jgi:hypothetical protein
MTDRLIVTQGYMITNKCTQSYLLTKQIEIIMNSELKLYTSRYVKFSFRWSYSNIRELKVIILRCVLGVR